MNNTEINLQIEEHSESQSAREFASAPSTPYTVCELDLKKHKDAVLSIWKNIIPPIPETKYSWMYEENPYGPAVGWLLLHSTGEAVGMVSLFPRGVHIYGSNRMAAVAGDFVVNTAHRTLGPALMLQKMVVANREKHNFDFVYGFPNQQAELVLQRAGYRAVGQPIRMTKVIRSHYYLSRQISSPMLVTVLTPVIDLILRCTSKEMRRRADSMLKCAVLLDFDERFDRLWEQVSQEITIAAHRKTDYLRWRYVGCPYMKYFIYAVMDKSTSHLLGYLIWYARATSTFIAELWTVNQPGIIEYLLSEFLRCQRRQNIDSVSISYFGRQGFMKKLREYGFAMRDVGQSVCVLTDSDAPWLSQLLTAENVCLFEGDADI